MAYFGGYIKKVLDDLKDLVSHEWDGVILTTGDEGDGKTTLNKLMAWYIDPKITIADVAFNAQQFELAVEQADEHSSILWDESDDLSGHWASIMIQTLKRKFKRIRSKHLFIWLVTPTFFDMNKYWAIHRARCLFHVYAQPQRDKEGNFKANRGRVRFFNKDKKRLLYFSGVKTWNMYAINPDFRDAFTKIPKDYPISNKEYEDKKDLATKMVTVNENNKSNPQNIRRIIIERLPRWLDNNRQKRKITTRDFAWILDVNERTIDNDLSFLRKNAYTINKITPEEGDGGINGDANSEVNISSLEQKNHEQAEETP
jgi:hypothetical protein